MNSTLDISLAFVETHPKSAARAVQEVDLDDAAAYLGSIPARYSVALISHLGSGLSASLIDRLSPKRASDIIRGIRYQTAVSIFRFISSEKAAEIYEYLPEKLARDIRASLTYPPDTVGAHLTPQIISMHSAKTIGDARKFVQSAHEAQAEQIFVVDEANRLLGSISPVELLRNPPNSILGKSLGKKVESVPVHARLSSIVNLEAWDENNLLPVLSRRKQLVGGLMKKDLKKATRPVTNASDGSSAPFNFAIVDEFFASAIGLIEILAEDPKSKVGNRVQQRQKGSI